MSEFNNFKNQLSHFVERQQQITYPVIGVIINTTTDYQYCDIQTERGIYSNVPAHDLPVKGDTAIIHFINGNYEQPVADCARRIPATTEDVNNYYNNECFNYHQNGDFRNNEAGYTGTYNIQTNESYTKTNNNSCILRNAQDYLEFTVDISQCTEDYFKFQAAYTGQGQLKIECFDNITGNVIQNVPFNMSYPYKIWTNELGRNGWSFNKETYPRIEDETVHQEIKFRITNVSEQELIKLDDDYKQAPCAMLIDAILVYDENNDTSYYPNVND